MLLHLSLPSAGLLPVAIMSSKERMVGKKDINRHVCVHVHECISAENSSKAPTEERPLLAQVCGDCKHVSSVSFRLDLFSYDLTEVVRDTQESRCGKRGQIKEQA